MVFSGHNCPPNHRIFSDQTSLGFAGNPATLQEEKFSDTIFWVDTVPLPEAGPAEDERARGEDMGSQNGG